MEMSRFVKLFITFGLKCLFFREVNALALPYFRSSLPTEAAYRQHRFIHVNLSFILPALLMLASIFNVHAEIATNAKWALMPTKELMKIGKGYLHETFIPDSALAVFSILTNRYSPQMSIPEKKEMVEAFNGLWQTYLFGYFDCAEASRVLLKSFEICDEAKLPIGRNYFNMGVMYNHMAALSGNSESLFKDATENYKQAFRAANEENDGQLLLAVFVNMTELATALNDPSIVAEEVEILKRRADDLELKKKWRYDFALKFYEGLDAFSKSDFKDASYHFKEMKGTIPPGDDPEQVRYVITSLLNTAMAEEHAGNSAEAKRIRLEALDICREFDLKDGVLQCLDELTRQFKPIDKELSTQYYTQYLAIKDTLLNYRQFASIKEIKIHQQLKDFNHQIADMKRKDERQIQVITIVLVIVIVTILLLLIIYTKNRKLKALNKVLYSKNLEYLKAEEQRRLLQKEREREGAPKLAGVLSQNFEDGKQQSTEENDAPSLKYKNSQLDREIQEQIMTKIMEVMEESEEIFQPGFSATNLSELTGINYKYLSQVINQTHGCNFNVFLNEFRVKKACMLIDSMSKSMPITIEGLANKVGFRSRNSFAVAFKKFTGLNPSEYIRAAKSS